MSVWLRVISSVLVTSHSVAFHPLWFVLNLPHSHVSGLSFDYGEENYTGYVKSESAEFDICVNSELLSDDFSCYFLNEPGIFFKCPIYFGKILQKSCKIQNSCTPLTQPGESHGHHT